MALSLQDLIHRGRLSQDLLHQEVSDMYLRELSRIIDNHEVVGPELGLTSAEMTDIKRDVRTHELQKLAMLRRWKQKFAPKATYGALIEALLKCSRADLARRVCELLVQSKCYSDNTIVDLQ